MGNLVDCYVSGRVKRGEIARTTRRRTLTVLRIFAETYGDRDPAKLSGRDVDRWLGERSHLAAGTRRSEWSVVHVFAIWLVQRGVVRRDPFIGKRPPKVPRVGGRDLSRDECEAIEAVLPDARAWAIYSLMRWLGLRRSEVLSIQVGDWDRRGRVLRVIGKGGHERIEPVPEWVSGRLATYLNETGATAGPLIRTLDGRRGISDCYVGALMRRWMIEAGVKRAPLDGRACHSLRHTIASELIESGADIKVVQELLGHASLTSTQVYLRRAAAGRVLEAMERARAA